MTAHLVIATPAHTGTVEAGFARSLLTTSGFLGHHGVSMSWQMLAGESLIQRARAHLVAQFMTDGVGTHLLFIDADVVWHAEDVLRMLRHDLDVVAGAYPLKSGEGPTQFAFAAVMRNDGTVSMCPRTRCIELDLAATGFLMIKREVFVKLGEAYPQSKIRVPCYHERNLQWLFDFFPAFIDDDGVLLSEDYGFCRRFRDIGGRVWCDPDCQLTHIGRKAWTGKLRDVLRPAGPR